MQNIDIEHGGSPLNTNTALLKLAAIILMTVDHVGMMLFPGQAIYRSIGRLAFPLFVYCCVVGCVYTRNFGKYALRMAVFAAITQPIYMFCFDRSLTQLNIFPTLLAGMLLVYCLKKRTYLSIAGALIIMLYALKPPPLPIISFTDGFSVRIQWLNFPLQYGAWGIGLFWVMYLTRQDRMAFMAAVGMYALMWGATGIGLNILGVQFDSQVLIILAVPLMAFPMNNIRIKLHKYFFYAFYPGHIVAIWAIKQLLLRP